MTGCKLKIEIMQSDFNPLQLLSDYQAKIPKRSGIGVATIFIGFMRDYNQGNSVESMHLEYYPEMTSSFLEQMVQASMEKHQLADVLLVHRVGKLQITEPIVLLAVWSAHRHSAYLANREMMEELKLRAPFWKKEKLTHGERWVEANKAG